MKKKLLSFVLAIILIFSSVVTIAMEEKTLETAIKETSEYIIDNTPEPKVGSIGGEWAIIGLARGNINVEENYFSDYYRRVESSVKEKTGVLHKKKYTEYSRVILALTAIGKNPMDVAGYNLLLPLGDFEKTVWQGINGPIWALIALDCGEYEIPENPDAKVQATRQMYIEYILNRQNNDGGWSLAGGGISDIDLTAMALQALSGYLYIDEVKAAVEKALSMLEKSQNDSGGFSSMGNANCESSAQVLTALCALGIKHNSSQFVKNEKTVLDDIMSYYAESGFLHIKTGAVNQMATEQAFYSLVALWRLQNNMPPLYTMTDNIKPESTNEDEIKEKHGVKNFADVINHQNAEAIESLAGAGIINGKSENVFEPESTMTRAEFATIIVKALSLTGEAAALFEDVKADDWFCNYVGAAYKNGIINGVSDTLFNPQGTITRQEAAVMICRSAKFLGIHTDMELMSARDILAAFVDYVKTAPWAIKELAFCVDKGIIDGSELEISPNQSVQRCEVAQMVYNLLRKAEKI